MSVSVLLCTHNPRRDYLARVLDALRAQTLPLGEWELIVVDNASVPSLDTNTVSWHPRGRVVREPTVGLVSARLRGISEAVGELLVWVDDDNLLAPDYLARAHTLALQWPVLGAFGGQVHGEFEVQPGPWFAARLDRLAIREFTEATRSRRPDPALLPCGAGLCMRAAVAQRYHQRTRTESGHAALGRRGTAVESGDDTDLVLTACELDLEIGRFPELHLRHLIPPGRLTWSYFARLTRGHARGQLRLMALHPGLPWPRGARWRARWALRKWTLLAALLTCLPEGRKSRSLAAPSHEPPEAGHPRV